MRYRDGRRWASVAVQSVVNGCYRFIFLPNCVWGVYIYIYTKSVERRTSYAFIQQHFSLTFFLRFIAAILTPLIQPNPKSLKLSIHLDRRNGSRDSNPLLRLVFDLRSVVTSLDIPLRRKLHPPPQILD